MASKSWNIFEKLKGDKVVWLITLILFLFSILCIFSSSTSLVNSHQSRLDIVKDQVKYVAMGLGLVVLIYNFGSVKLIRAASRIGLAISLILLGILVFGELVGGDLGPIHVEKRNGAVRAFTLFGKQVYVYEVVKVAMVMYIARRVDDLEKDNFPLLNKLGKSFPWMRTPAAKRWLTVYAPFLLVCVLVMKGSNSSAIFIGGIMALTLCIGTGKKKDITTLLCCAAAGAALILGAHFVSGGKMFPRIKTLFSRTADNNWEEIMKTSKPNSLEYSKALDNLRQPYSAKIAVHQGGLIGKGPGQSTQRYVVPDMCSDYMFSFIVEEYGLWVGAIVIILFASLLARGSIIIRNCGKNALFEKTAIAGLVLLISLQAFMHICVNVGIGPLTGQTLPILSNGTGAMLCFSVAFGVILSISRKAEKGVSRELKNAEPIAVQKEAVEASLDELEQFENEEYEDTI